MFDGMMDDLPEDQLLTQAEEIDLGLLVPGVDFLVDAPPVAVPAPTEPSGATEPKQEQALMSDEVFHAWTGYELSGGIGRGGKTEPMVLSAFAEALKGKKVLVVTSQGNVVMELQPAAPEPEITFDEYNSICKAE